MKLTMGMFGAMVISVLAAVCLLENGTAAVLDSTDEPLFLTPLIESGHIVKAKALSRVQNLPNAPDIESYTGYFTVNKNYESNLFFWFFPAWNDPANAPMLLWLQGGPGASSLFGLFVENGPFVVNADQTVALRNVTWAQTFSMLYIDQPAGTGYSFTGNDRGYARTEEDVARDLYEALQQFFKLFPEYCKNEFYITGESYGGKYVPAIAYKILQEGLSSGINLQGIAIGNGLSDPETMMNYADFLYQVGMLDSEQAAYFRKEQDIIVQSIKKKQWKKAYYVLRSLMFTADPQSYFTNVTGFKFHYNILMSEQPVDFTYYESYIQSQPVRHAIHVGNLTFHDDNDTHVQDALIEDFMQSVKPWVAFLMENTRVLYYNGQLDIIVAYPLTENFLQSVQWKHAEEYRKAPKIIWKLHPSDSEAAGYVKNVHDFYEVGVRRAGHILPYDQPRVAFDMIRRFIYKEKF